MSLIARKWIPVHAQPRACDRSSSTITVMSWNTLARSLCNVSSFPNTDPAVLEWNNRATLIEKQLFHNTIAPDIIALQEVDEEDADEFLLALCATNPYTLRYSKKQSENSKDGCALLIQAGRWTVHRHFTVPLGAPGTSQIALIAQISSSCNQSRPIHMTVVSVHLKSKPGNEEIRACQGRVLREQIDLACVNHPAANSTGDNITALVMGDFNDVPDSIVVTDMLKLGSFQSAYDSFYPCSFYTTAKKRQEVVTRTVDYIFVRVGQAMPRTDSSIVSLMEIPPLIHFPTLLPCKQYPSDHLALGAQIQL
jgi:mRNA deadenylase 3'-5' endonuclease subunit Ccr4